MLQVDYNVRYGDEPAVLVVSDTAEARADAVALVMQAGGRAIAPPGFAAGIAALGDLAAPTPVLVAAEQDQGAAFDALLARLEADAAARRRPSLIAIPAALIDAAAAGTSHPLVTLLAEATAAERAAALAAAIALSHRAELQLGEQSTAPTQLLQLSEEVGRIARTLAALSGAGERRGGILPGARNGDARPPSAATVRAMIRSRRLREQFFPGAYFADPAWDMMLDLYAARLEERPVAVSSLCIAAAVPPTTALRWMKQLVDDGLFVRIADPRDGRRVFIELSAEALHGLAAYFEAVGRLGFAVP